MAEILTKIIELTPEQQNDLLKKYENTLIVNYPKKSPVEQAYIIDYCYNHLKNNYNNLSSDLNAWTVVVIKKLYEINKITTEDNINDNIKNFIGYYNQNHSNHIETIGQSCSDYDRDIVFITSYLNTIISPIMLLTEPQSSSDLI